MSRLSRLLAIACTAVASCASVPRAEGERSSFTLAAGPMSMGAEGWDVLDERVLVSFELARAKPDWPCELEAAAQYARAESTDDTVADGADFFAVSAGARWTWRPVERLSLVAGVGPRLAFAMLSRPGTYNEVTENGVSVGVYAHAGAFCRVAGRTSIGLDARWVDGTDYALGGVDRDAAVTALMVALRWDF